MAKQIGERCIWGDLSGVGVADRCQKQATGFIEGLPLCGTHQRQARLRGEIRKYEYDNQRLRSSWHPVPVPRDEALVEQEKAKQAERAPRCCPRCHQEFTAGQQLREAQQRIAALELQLAAAKDTIDLYHNVAMGRVAKGGR